VAAVNGCDIMSRFLSAINWRTIVMHHAPKCFTFNDYILET